MKVIKLLIVLTVLVAVNSAQADVVSLGDYSSFSGDSVSGYVFKDINDNKLRVSASGGYIVRVQAARAGEGFLADDHYEMVANHDMGGELVMTDRGDRIAINSIEPGGVSLVLSKNPMRLTYYSADRGRALLADRDGICWDGNRIYTDLQVSNDHFFGVGHPEYSRQGKLDLTGTEVKRNYEKQAPLLVPFYFSHKGYGIFMNSTFENCFRFNVDGEYSFGIDGKGFGGQMDYYFIVGPKVADILDRYSQLTGRPRLPQKSMFGLQLSDKGSPRDSDEQWWMKTINEHRAAGYPIDHIVNDNRWRAGSGAWAGSRFEWAIDEGRYPDPARWCKWVKDNGLTMTLDLNRNSCANSWGWKDEYNIPNAECVNYGHSTPDYTSQAVRDWNWELFWNKTFDPALGYGGDALWMDEPDDIGCIADSTIMADGRSWAENKNNYFFLIAKAVVEQGWDNENKNDPPGIGDAKRPFVWVRGMTAGGQRYATHWSGDVNVTFEAMAEHVRAMQASGLAAFPYYNHDAGGFHNPGPVDDLYRQWSMAFGSFSPIWRPHGPGKYDRWPLKRNEECQADAMVYSHLRYEMMPYIYTLAWQAHDTAMPMARAMVIDHQNEKEAWSRDMQYMWGPSILVAPNCTPGNDDVSVWLPGGCDWYDLWTGKVYKGDQVISYYAKTGVQPMFVKQGAIIPKSLYATSTFWLPKDTLVLDVYAGQDGEFELYEDDGVTEYFRSKDACAITGIKYDDKSGSVTVNAIKGSYDGIAQERRYRVNFYGVEEASQVIVNGEKLAGFGSIDEVIDNGTGFVYLADKKQVFVMTKRYSVKVPVSVNLAD